MNRRIPQYKNRILNILFCSKTKKSIFKNLTCQKNDKKTVQNEKINLWKRSNSKRPQKKFSPRNRHRNGIFAILLVEQGIRPPPQPIRMMAANHLQPARLPFGLQKAKIWRGQFIIWLREVMIIVIVIYKLSKSIFLVLLLDETTSRAREQVSLFPSNHVLSGQHYVMDR